MEKERYIRRLETILDNVGPVLYGRAPRGGLFCKELELFALKIKRFCFFAHKNHVTEALHQKHIDDFIRTIESIEFEPHEETAATLYDFCARIYNLHVEPTITTILSEHKKDFNFEEVQQSFQHLKEAYYKSYVGLSPLPLRYRSRNKNYEKNKRIFVNLSSLIYISFFVVDDFQKASQMLNSVFNHMEHLLPPLKGIILNDTLERLNHLPKPLHQGLCYYFFQIGAITEVLYYRLELSITSKDYKNFTNIVIQNNLELFFSKYYELISLADELYSILIERKFEPECFIRLISDYYKHISEDKSKRNFLRGICVTTLGIFNDIKDFNEIPQTVYIKYPVYKPQLFLVYERFCKIKYLHVSCNSERKLSSSADEVDNINSSPVCVEVNCPETISSENELNCKFPDRIDDFINYLAWTEYIKEGDQSSLKYDIFGGPKPSDYRSITYNFNRSKSRSTMLGIIVWQLREKNTVAPVLFNKTIGLANQNIGVNKYSQRIFIDTCLFFPSLINSLIIRDTNKKNSNRIMRENLKKRVKQLLASDEYINCLSILDFIKQLEVQDVQYWVVDKFEVD